MNSKKVNATAKPATRVTTRALSLTDLDEVVAGSGCTFPPRRGNRGGTLQ